jgi:hypothetical protein
MMVIHMFGRVFKGIGNDVVQYLQYENPYMIAMDITYVGLRNDYKGQR